MRALGHSAAALAAGLAAPLAAGVLLVRPRWRVGLRERLGVAERLPPGAIWVHGASVGEMFAAARLVERLRKAGRPVITSTVTLSGRQLMRERRPEVPCRLAPIDHPWCVESALARVRPAALVLIETELWPCWIAAADRRGVPVVLVSGRVSDRSYPRYRRVGFVMRRTLARVGAVGARTAADAERLIALGADPARLQVTGDLKLELDPGERGLAPDLTRVIGSLPIFVAGSTHSGEEVAALAAQDAIERAGHRTGLVIAPRHPERAAEVVRTVQATGRSLRRRTALGGAPLKPGEVLILDSLGELPALYASAEVAFVGGSLVARGGHNVLEPVLAGTPVLYGPHVANVRHAAGILERCGAAMRLSDAALLGPAVADWLTDLPATRRRGQVGRLELLRHRGSAERAAAMVEAAILENPRGGV